MKHSKEMLILNDLIHIHNDRAAAYKKMSDVLTEEDLDLKGVFNQYMIDSKLYANKLERLVASLGGDLEDMMLTGTIYRIWMDVKAIFAGPIKTSVLNACEAGERAIQKAYQFAIESSDEISDDTMDILEDHQFALNEAYKSMKLRRDISVSA